MNIKKWGQFNENNSHLREVDSATDPDGNYSGKFRSEYRHQIKNRFLYIVIDDIEYKAWMWNPSAIKREVRDNLIEENSWLIEVENNKTGSSKPFKCENCLDISPYFKGDNYLDSEEVRSLLINKTKEYHEISHK